MSLNDVLRSMHEQRHEVIPAEILEVMDRAGSELAASEPAERALAVGERAPRFVLPGADGATVDSQRLLARGPLIVTFYRGAWCPFCNVALQALQEYLPRFTERGARLVAVSPQVPDESLSLAERHGLDFDVVSDVGSQTAEEFGLAFTLPAELAAAYERLGFDLQRVNGGHPRTLPLPATFLLDGAGVVRWSFVDPDYTRRAEPEELLAALDRLSAAAGETEAPVPPAGSQAATPSAPR